jgi:hypothetical protein
MFLVGNMRASGLTDNGRAFEGSYAAALTDGKITGVVAHYWNQNMVFQAPVHLNLLWRAAVEASQRSISGLIGPNDQVAMAKEALEIDDSRIQLDETEKLYSLNLADLVVPEDLTTRHFSG